MVLLLKKSTLGYQSGEMGQVYTFNGGNSADPGTAATKSIQVFSNSIGSFSEWILKQQIITRATIFLNQSEQWVRSTVSDELGGG